MIENHPYVFFSYAHKNADVTLPCMDALRKSGVNLWYDDGIEAGSEWPEFIAQKVVDCNKFVLFVSNAYLDSQNCKRELNFAISRKKEILSIFIEEVSLSPGMEMQLGSYQAVYLNRFPSRESFFISLCKEPFFDSCRLSVAEEQTPQPVEKIPDEKKDFRTEGKKKGEKYKLFVNRYIKSRAVHKKSRILAALLAFFLGILGVHKFYLGQWFLGILYLVFLLIGCATVSFVIMIPVICPIIEMVLFLVSKKDKLKKRYGCDFKWL